MRSRPAPSAPPAQDTPGLGVFTGSALMISGVVGTGVLVLPGLAVRDAGPAALVAVAALLVVSVPLAATFAALGARHPSAGGVSHHVRNAFGPRSATVAAWWFYLGVPMGVPAMGMFAGEYVQAAVGGGAVTRSLTALAVVLIAAAVNLRGTAVSGRFQVGLTGVLVVAVLGALLVSLPGARFEELAPFAPHGWGVVAPTALLLVWMLTGWEAAAHLTGRFRSAARDVRVATAAALVVVAVLFGGTTLVLAVTPDASVVAGSAPVTELLRVALGPAAAGIAAVLALVVTVGSTNTYLAGLTELGVEMGRVGQAPRWLAGRDADRPGTRSLVLVTTQALVGLGVVTLFAVPVEQLIRVTAASQVAVFGAALLAALRLLPRRSPGWWAAASSTVPVLVLAVLCGWALLVPAGLAVAAVLSARGATRGDAATPTARRAIG